MKTKILSILALLLMTVTQGAWAQDSDKLRIGSGTGTSNFLPSNTNWNYSYTQQIYTVEELGEAGLIKSIDFYMVSATAYTRNLDIYMVSTDKESFSSTTDWITVTDADKVFSGNVNFVAQDWTTITLDEPFIYDGSQNVAIIVDDNTIACSKRTFSTFTTTANQALYKSRDNTDIPIDYSDSGNLLSSKNQIRILKEAMGDCMKPTGLAATGVTNNAATLTWRENGAATTWVIDYNGETVEVTDNPYTLTSLDAATVYTVKVRPACDENKWSATVTFTTLANNAVPYELTTTSIYANAVTLNWSGVQDSYNVRYRTPSPSNIEGFEDESEFTANWTVISNNTANSGELGRIGDAKRNGSYGFRFSSSNTTNKDYNQYLISHELSDAKSVDFYYCVHNSIFPEAFKVGYSTTGNDVSDFTWSEAISTSSTSWNHFEPLNLPDGVKYVAINYCPSESCYYLYIDDLTIVTGEAGDWVNKTNVTSPLDINGLEQETKYEWQVQGIYNGEPTEWSTMATFTTTNEFKPGTAIDLGLPSGKKWADRNVGAASATGYGTYYAWSSSDIATAQWGVNWRMPTLTEIEELQNYTDHEWATIGGINGMKFMKKTDHSVYIFLPATGYNSSTEVGTIGYHWTSTEESSPHAYFLYTSSSSVITSYYRTKTSLLPIRPVQMFAGEGTEASPYLIASTTDWNNLSAAVNGGETYSGKYFKMTANIGTVTTMIGASDKPFRGTFDGQGHTLTVSYTASTHGTAPFPRTASTTLIKNLRVAGTITGGDFKVAGLVSEPVGATIEHCRVSATISANAYHGLWIGGFCNGGNVTIKNCLFDGKINCVGGGFIGYSETTSRITNCLFAPQTGSSLGSSQDGNGVFIYTKDRGSNLGTITNCYYTSLANGVAQGTNGSGMTAAQLVENLGPSNWKVVGGNAIPKVHPNLSGEGTLASPYLIASTTDWNNLVSAVNAGETYNGNYFKMTANIGTVSTWMTGTFSGTFDGYGNTLTVDYTATSQRCGAFGYLGSASIQNLKVAGTISTAYQAAGGLATWCNEGASAYITNCRVSTIISSSVSGDGTHGGFVAYTDGKLYFTGCVFDGSLTGSTTNACSGFVYNSGWNGAAVSLTDCLLAPSSVTIGTGASATFVRGMAPTITNCYYTQTFGTAQGTQAHTIAAGDYVSSLSVTKGSATATYTVSGITVYSGGIDFNDGSTTTFYGGSGQTVSLALTAETRTGYQFKQYAASQGTLSAQTATSATLTMPAANSTANDAVTIRAEYNPLYNADFADGNDNDGWSIDPTSGVAGTSVTVSYTGENKVKSVTVTKLALCSLSEVTSEHVGKIIGADGNVYASLAQAVKVTTAVGILGKVTETGHGLIMSLEDAPQQVWATIDGWASASYAGTTLKVLPDDDARGSNLPSYTTLGSTTVSNWAVATRTDYTAIFTNLGSTGGDNDGISYDANMNAKITGAGGTAISGQNWSSTQYDSSKAWRFASTWGGRNKTDQYKVRPVLGF